MRIKGEQSLVLDTENDEQSSRIKIRIMIIDDSFVPPLICSVSVGEELSLRVGHISAQQQQQPRPQTQATRGVGGRGPR